MSSETKFLLNSGEIYRAFTLNDSNTSIIFSTLFSSLALINLFLCSDNTASENS